MIKVSEAPESQIIRQEFFNKLVFIENVENYYPMFKYVIETCARIQVGNLVLCEDGYFTDSEYLDNIRRIEKAKELAIKTHGEWTINMLEQSKAQHSVRALVSSVYSDIFGVELKGELQ